MWWKPRLQPGTAVHPTVRFLSHRTGRPQGSPNDLKLEWKAQKEEQARIRDSERAQKNRGVHSRPGDQGQRDRRPPHLEEVYTDVPRLMELNKEKKRK